MSVLKRITQLITPPPLRKRPSAVESPPLPPVAAGHVYSLKPLIKALVLADSLKSPEAVEALDEIKRTATRKGFYLTAFEIKNVLDGMPRVDSEGVYAYKERGYLLSADFLLEHIRREIQALRTKPNSIGPNIFKGYCNEMIGCLLNGPNRARAIEIPVLVIDELLFNAVDWFDRGEVFLTLAKQASTSAVELVGEDAAGRRRRTGKEQPGETETGALEEDERMPQPLSEAAVNYLTALHQKIESMHAAFLDYKAALIADQARSRDGKQDALGRLEDLLGIANASRYRPLAALIMARIGNLLESVEPARAFESYGRAAQLYRDQAYDDARLVFTKLAEVRSARARELFLKINEPEHAARVESEVLRILAQARGGTTKTG